MISITIWVKSWTKKKKLHEFLNFRIFYFALFCFITNYMINITIWLKSWTSWKRFFCIIFIFSYFILFYFITNYNQTHNQSKSLNLKKIYKKNFQIASVFGILLALMAAAMFSSMIWDDSLRWSKGYLELQRKNISVRILLTPLYVKLCKC